MKPHPILLTPLLAVMPHHHASAGISTALTADVSVDTRGTVPVTIPDPALLAALRTALAKPTGDITEADLLTLTTLRIDGLGISDLSGLERAKNLRILDIRRNSFSDPVALWAVLDQITPMYCLYVDVRRPGIDPAGLIVETLTDTTGNSFFILVDAPNLPTLDFDSLDVDTSSASNLAALETIADAGVEIDTAGVNLPPYASASAEVTDAATREVTLTASAGDIDGSIVSYVWSWPGGSSSSASPSLTLPYGNYTFSLTVTDDDGATATDETSLTLLPGATLDTDGDGLSDFLEYACNLNIEEQDRRILAETSGTAGLPAIRLDNSSSPARLRMEFLRRKDASASGITYEAQWSSDATSWSTGYATIQVTSIDGQWERVVVTDPSPNAKRFARLAIISTESP